MKILTLLILLCNVITLILVIVYHIVNNKLVKEYERRMKLVRIVCDSTLYLLYSYSDNKFSKEEIKDTLCDVIDIIDRGYYE